MRESNASESVERTAESSVLDPVEREGGNMLQVEVERKNEVHSFCSYTSPDPSSLPAKPLNELLSPLSSTPVIRIKSIYLFPNPHLKCSSTPLTLPVELLIRDVATTDGASNSMDTSQTPKRNHHSNRERL